MGFFRRIFINFFASYRFEHGTGWRILCSWSLLKHLQLAEFHYPGKFLKSAAVLNLATMREWMGELFKNLNDKKWMLLMLILFLVKIPTFKNPNNHLLMKIPALWDEVVGCIVLGSYPPLGDNYTVYCLS